MMKSYSLYKQNIKHNKNMIIISAIIILLGIVLMDIYNIKTSSEYTDMQLIYLNLGKGQIMLYVLLSCIITLKLLSFSSKYLYIVRIGDKNKLWKIIIQHIVYTNIVISSYIVIVSYIFAKIFSKQKYTNDLNTITILIILLIIISICCCLFGVFGYILKSSTNSDAFTFIILIIILLIDMMLPNNSSILLSNLSFNPMYIKNKLLAIYNIVQYGGVSILLFELGRYLNKKKEIYKTKDKLGVGNQYE